ncbi:hypothetical protein [Cupriavidus sp. TMH.W2]|uniref:hypothetical protein n=1 Tax=Cupriavidus sp. TMH.W2 TaxID=3434465 RepID=UPI003D77AF3E
MPVPLGGKHLGVVAYRQGCGELLYPDGKPAAVERFSGITLDSWADDRTSRHVRYRLDFAGGPAAEHAYVRFTNGKKSAESPHHYVSSASWDIAFVQAGQGQQLRIEAIAVPGGFGVLDMRTLREVLRPEWERISTIEETHTTVPQELNGPAYLVATKDGSQVFSLSGERVDIPLFDEIEVLYNFFFPVSSGGRPDPVLWRTIDRKANGCMLYSMSFRPLLPTPIPLDHRGECPADHWKDSPGFAVTDANRKTHMYRKELAGPEGILIQSAMSIDGSIAFHYSGGSLILKRDRGGRPEYRLVNPEGRDIAGASFDTFRRGGCGTSPEVMKDGLWWSLSPGGKLNPPIYGSSC